MNTNAVTQTDNSAVTSNYASTSKSSKTDYGSSIGSPELSDSAAKYYDQLKKKYSDMDFVLVSEDQKANAQANVGNYANANRTVVLIDTDKIEKMATDESYRKQYEGIISGATAQLNDIKSGLGDNASSVKTYGIQVNDSGTASFFAVIDESQEAQRVRIEKNNAKKTAEKAASDEKETNKLAEKKKTDKESVTDKAGNTDKVSNANKATSTDKTGVSNSADTVIVTASSVEELIKKINDTLYADMSDYVQTEAEKKSGQNIDFSV